MTINKWRDKSGRKGRGELSFTSKRPIHRLISQIFLRQCSPPVYWSSPSSSLLHHRWVAERLSRAPHHPHVPVSQFSTREKQRETRNTKMSCVVSGCNVKWPSTRHFFPVQKTRPRVREWVRNIVMPRVWCFFTLFFCDLCDRGAEAEGEFFNV